MSLYAIILAGGASSRFWPLSGDEHPKYLLKPDGANTLLELAWNRAAACTSPQFIMVVTARAQAAAVRTALPALEQANLCIEPARRDTAAAIALGCKAVASRDAQADVLVLPADTLIEPQKALARALATARALPDYDSAIHVFGAKPSRPEGSFGYIELGAEVAKGVHAVASFVEKPGERAADMVRHGLLWNAGCFFFRLSTFQRELSAHLPSLSDRLRPAAPGSVAEEDYNALQSISIDYGLIEKARNLRVALLDAEFDDIGTWDALLRRGGVGEGGVVSVGGARNAAHAPGRTVAVVGESDLLVVAEGDRILVLKRGHGQQVKQAAQSLEAGRNA
jgi:mannose-1-phosphate guanylyltransferase